MQSGRRRGMLLCPGGSWWILLQPEWQLESLLNLLLSQRWEILLDAPEFSCTKVVAIGVCHKLGKCTLGNKMLTSAEGKWEIHGNRDFIIRGGVQWVMLSRHLTYPVMSCKCTSVF